MNLGEYEKEIENTLENMKDGKKKRALTKMYLKFKGQKMLKIGNSKDKENIDKEKDMLEKKIKEGRK